ncbi:MAG: hypothetical protein HC809_06475 [Gammaproteobacteria bacterium]|nr:hypothetical protein [Gammaproteobacteria bacterium]
MIQWLDSFAIGIPRIDAEHRELIDLINTSHERLIDPASPEPSPPPGPGPAFRDAAPRRRARRPAGVALVDIGPINLLQMGQERGGLFRCERESAG